MNYTENETVFMLFKYRLNGDLGNLCVLYQIRNKNSLGTTTRKCIAHANSHFYQQLFNKL